MIKTTLDTRAFDKALAEYMKFTKRSIADVINAKLWFIARNATNTTKAADRTKIEGELRGPARDYPKTPLVNILVNKQLKAKGQSAISGAKMKAASERFIKGRIRSINFLRSGWIPAIRDLEVALKRGDINFSKRFAPKQNRQVKKYGQDKGSVIWAKPERERERTFGEIENAVQGGKKPGPQVRTTIESGLQKAVNQEIASMKTYIERKLNPATDKFNK